MIWAIHRVRVRVLEERQHVLEREQRLLEQHQGEIRALNERWMKAQEEERIRIAGELHDGVLQQITSLTLRLGTAIIKLPPDADAKARIKQSQKELMQVGTGIRNLSHELHPVVLQESGLPSALTSYCEEFGRLRGIRVSCEAIKVSTTCHPGQRFASTASRRKLSAMLGGIRKPGRRKFD